MTGKQLKYGEFTRRQPNLSSVHLHFMGQRIDRQLVHLNFMVFVGQRHVQPRIPAKLGFDSGDQLQRVKGLRYIIVGPCAEAENFVHILTLGGEHDDRHVFFARVF